jgi:ABC-type phosphate/phosphonate transport system substrate-binding protein
VIVIKQDPLYYDLARAAVATRGGSAIAKAPTPLAGSFNAAIGALATGKADVALMPGEQWQAGCAADKPLCGAYEVAWQDRPVAESAWVLRAGLPDELRYRLIGIFLPLHLENAQAYAGASGGTKGVFEPTEATALDGSPER